MDLLGSILSSMDAPPTANEKQKEIMKKQKEQAEKILKKEKDELNRYRKYVEERIERFKKDEKRKSIQFEPMDKVYRTVVHDIAEVAGLVGISFGQEGLDRYIVVYKKEYSPTEDEVNSRKDGDDQWNEEKAKNYAINREQNKLQEIENAKKTEDRAPPTSNYKDKYVHLIGQESAIEAARKTVSNKSYGFVPSANKKDIRSIEQTQRDIQAKKRLKTSHETTTTEQVGEETPESSN